MERKQFNTTIAAPREKVWQTLWNDTTYRQWTAPFQAGSHAVSDWKQGSKVLFLDPNGSGMASEIAEMIPNEIMKFRHLRSVKDGKELMDDPADKEWAGSMENYYLKSNGKDTELTVEFDTKGLPKDMLDYFVTVWPKALAKLKEIAEK